MGTDIDTIYISEQWATPMSTSRIEIRSSVTGSAGCVLPIIAPRAFSHHARRVYGTATPLAKIYDPAEHIYASTPTTAASRNRTVEASTPETRSHACHCITSTRTTSTVVATGP
jgi:hypothetical protein